MDVGRDREAFVCGVVVDGTGLGLGGVEGVDEVEENGKVATADVVVGVEIRHGGKGSSKTVGEVVRSGRLVRGVCTGL